MIHKSKVLALALAVTGLGAAAPALAQAQPEAPKPVQVSREAAESIRKLDAAVKAKDFTNFPALVAEATAKAKTVDDRYAIASMQLRASQAQNDTAGTLAAVDTMLATGRVPPAEASKLRFSVAQMRFQAKQFDQAAAGFEQVVAADPANLDALVLLAETRNAQNRPADAVPLLLRAIEQRTASGQKAPESWYNRAAALAFNNKLPNAPQVARSWAQAYPSAASWRAALLTYEPTSGLTGPDLLDLYRLQRAAGALKGESDHFRYVDQLIVRGFPGEAKAVLDEAFAANAVDRNRPLWRDLHSSASSKVAADKASLPAAEKTALSPAGTARQALVTGDAFLGYGDYARAAALYRAALNKAGADKNLVNLRLGVALARAGDRAGATSALQAVQGQRADLAQLWLTWLNSRA